MKKILAFLLAMMMVLSLVACGGNEKTPSGSGDNTPSNSEQQGQEDNGQDEDGGNGSADQIHLLSELAAYSSIPEFARMGIGTLVEIEDEEFIGRTEDATLWLNFEDAPKESYELYVQHLIDSGGKGDEACTTEMTTTLYSNLAYFEWGKIGAYRNPDKRGEMRIAILVYSPEQTANTGEAGQSETSDSAEAGDGDMITAGSYDGPFDDKWPDCVWTRLVPKPEFSEKSNEESYSAEALVNGFAAAYTDVTMDEAKEYVKAVQAAGFDQSITENGNDTLYYYMAFNEDHVKFELNLNPVLGTTILMQ